MLYRTTARRLRAAISRGTWKPGERVVSTRALAAREGVSLPTAVAALRVLEAEGLIVARPRSGYFVCGEPPALPSRSSPPRKPREVTLEGILRDMRSEAQSLRFPFNAALPAPEWLPQRAMQQSLRRATQHAQRDAHSYSAPPGRARLRQQIAAHAALWGAGFGPDDLVVTSGDTQALRLALLATSRPGDTVAIESPAYFGLLLLLASLGLKALEIPTHPARGIDLAELARALGKHRICAVVASPTVQNPLGASMSMSDKRALLRLLERECVPLIEDDIFGDLAGPGPRPPACKAFDESGNVLYCSSFSKSLAPGWRIGWIAAGRFHDAVLRLRWHESLAGTTLLEDATADLLARGEYRRHLRRLLPRIESSVRAMTARVEASFPPGTRIARPTAGYLLWIELPESVDALEVHRRAATEGIGVAPGHLFSPQPQFTHHLRLSCAAPVTPALLGAIDRVGQMCTCAVSDLEV
jgi:DNA-binding transcriptional MocR family regulator